MVKPWAGYRFVQKKAKICCTCCDAQMRNWKRWTPCAYLCEEMGSQVGWTGAGKALYEGILLDTPLAPFFVAKCAYILPPQSRPLRNACLHGAVVLHSTYCKIMFHTC